MLQAALACNEGTRAAAGDQPGPAMTASQAAGEDAAPPADAGPIRMEESGSGGGPPVFVLRGAPQGQHAIVFLHGMCGHGLGYAQSFQFSAARFGRLVAPQGDVSCGGPWSKWSGDVERLDARIQEAFRELGHQAPLRDVLVIGMSQGASRAAQLAAKWPERYTRLIAMAGPTTLNAAALRSLRSSVTMAGERDRQDLMRQSARALQASGVPSTFIPIPQASHGAMGPTPEQTMAEALTWIYAIK